MKSLTHVNSLRYDSYKGRFTTAKTIPVVEDQTLEGEVKHDTLRTADVAADLR
jgi:hypothetical protein